MNSVGTCPTEEWKPAQLSGHVCAHTLAPQTRSIPASTWDGTRCESAVPRKEVIQPHLPVRLPCYDFTPIADPTFDSSLLAVGPLASGVTNFRGVTGGVYKARERIHPDVADSGLLATPTSRSRVADFDPN